MEKLSERFIYYCGVLAGFRYDPDVKVDDLKHIQKLIDAEEQGLLLKLPCKVGDFVHVITQEYTECTSYKEQFDEYNCQGCESECDSHKIYIVKPVEITTVNQIVNKLEEFGKTVFLTRQEAEKKIRENRQMKETF